MTATPGDDQLIRTWADRLRSEFPNAVAIILKGSHARGGAGRFSDIDFDVLTEGERVERYPVWIEPDSSGRPRHISVAVQDLDAWLDAGSEPESWAFGLPVREDTRLLWTARPELRATLDRPWRPHPPEDPELEDFVESLGKARNALDASDEPGLHLATRGVARYAPTLLRPLNPDVWASSPRTALEGVLSFAVAPPGYRTDMLACLGFTPSASPTALFDAASRLVTGTLALLMEHIDTVTPLLPDDLAELLRHGTLRRYVDFLLSGDEP